MSDEFKREDRYMVFKISDVVEHCTKAEALHLARLYEIQRVGRKDAGKAELECVVVESDWPEYEPTWRAIEARAVGSSEESAVQTAPSFVDAYQGAMEEVAIWKMRALEAEDLNRKFIAEINGPTHMGEPAQPTPSVPKVDALAQFIREIDGRHELGAGALAERIVEWLAASPKPEVK
jgi:hypothetical protein